MSARPGRPVADDPRRHVISVRLTEQEYLFVKQAAERYDLPLSVWTRERLVAAAKRAAT